MSKVRDIYNKSKEFTKNKLKYHLVDSTSLLAESTPFFAAYEKGLAGMSDQLSINARLFAAGLTYLGGMGYVFAKGRDVYRKFLNITDKSKEKVQTLHDGIYTGLFNSVAAPLIYFACGSRDVKEIAIGTGCAIGLGVVNGPLLGYSVDVFRDLTGLGNCERKTYPNFVKKQPSKIKKAIAAGLVAGSLAITSGIYSLIPDKEQTPIQPSQGIEQMVSNENINQNTNLEVLMEEEK
jgi:hypothetical protein